MKRKKIKRDTTKTRAAIDRCLFDLYYWLYDEPRENITGRLKMHNIDFTIVDDLRTLGMLDSEGYGKGQTHHWIGAYPTPALGDAIEKLREKRRLERQQREQEGLIDEEQAVDQLLDLRNQIDRKLAELGRQSRLF